MGADCIEPDLVATSDGVLVARHENDITGTTDVASRPELTDRRRSQRVDGQEVTGWFAEDLTLVQLRTLWAVERLPRLRPDNTAWDRRLKVPTLTEILVLRAELSVELDREIVVYIELKHPGHLTAAGLFVEDLLVAELAAAGLHVTGAPVIVQCFEWGPLRRLRHRHGVTSPLVLLSASSGAPPDLALAGDRRTYADLLTPRGLAELTADVDAIGPDKQQVIPWCADGSLAEPTSLVTDAHAAGLAVHPWTFRAENHFLPPALRTGTDPTAHGDLPGELAAYLDAGVDGFFTDHPDVGVAARDAHSR